MNLPADDFTKSPWSYPGTPAAHGGLMTDDGFQPLTPGDGGAGDALLEGRSLEDLLRAAGVAGVDERHLVVAVGSNASPAVMRRKLTSAEVSTVLPFVEVTAHGLAVGHSAHVSPPGYFPTAPYLSLSTATRTVASLLDAEQLACVDRTEPNYSRRALGPLACRLEAGGVVHPSTFQLFVSRWGVLCPPGKAPWPVQPQEQLFSRLARECAGFAEIVERFPGTRASMAALAADARLRTRVRKALQVEGWASPCELETGQSAG